MFSSSTALAQLVAKYKAKVDSKPSHGRVARHDLVEYIESELRVISARYQVIVRLTDREIIDLFDKIEWLVTSLKAVKFIKFSGDVITLAERMREPVVGVDIAQDSFFKLAFWSRLFSRIHMDTVLMDVVRDLSEIHKKVQKRVHDMEKIQGMVCVMNLEEGLRERVAHFTQQTPAKQNQHKRTVSPDIKRNTQIESANFHALINAELGLQEEETRIDARLKDLLSRCDMLDAAKQAAFKAFFWANGSLTDFLSFITTEFDKLFFYDHEMIIPTFYNPARNRYHWFYDAEDESFYLEYEREEYAFRLKEDPEIFFMNVNGSASCLNDKNYKTKYHDACKDWKDKETESAFFTGRDPVMSLNFKVRLTFQQHNDEWHVVPVVVKYIIKPHVPKLTLNPALTHSFPKEYFRMAAALYKQDLEAVQQSYTDAAPRAGLKK